MKLKVLTLLTFTAVFLTPILVMASLKDKKEEPYKIAMITDSGDIDDKSFNEIVYTSCKDWCKDNNYPFTYFRPKSDTFDEREKSIELAIDTGCNIIFLPGYTYASNINSIANKYPNVRFIGIDQSEDDYASYAPSSNKYILPNNVVCFSYEEQISGFLAGYASVFEGYRKLGFLGGMAVDAVKRYGYGYLLGIDYAAEVLDVHPEINYVYGGQFFGDADITIYMDNWYKNGTEVIFSCGGRIYTSAAQAAKLNGENKKVIGVDTDQAAIIDEGYGEGRCITSALKNIERNVIDELDNILKDNNFKSGFYLLGIDGPDDESNYVGLSTKNWRFTNFTKQMYDETIEYLFQLKSRGIEPVPRDTDKIPELKYSKLNYKETIK